MLSNVKLGPMSYQLYSKINFEIPWNYFWNLVKIITISSYYFTQIHKRIILFSNARYLFYNNNFIYAGMDH